jgi:hypothetical protein
VGIIAWFIFYTVSECFPRSPYVDGNYCNCDRTWKCYEYWHEYDCDVGNQVGGTSCSESMEFGIDKDGGDVGYRGHLTVINQEVKEKTFVSAVPLEK